MSWIAFRSSLRSSRGSGARTGPDPGLAGGAGDQASLDLLRQGLAPTGPPRWSADLTPGGDRTRVETGGAATSWQPDAAHRYQRVAGQTPRYDAGGRLIAWAGFQFGYDHRDRLVRVEDAAGATVATRTFDACGRPITWTTPAGLRRAIPVGLDVLGEDAGGVTLRYAPGLGIDQPVAVHDGTEWRLLHRDPSWSVLATSSPPGVVLDRASWGPGGEATALTPAFAPAPTLGAHIRFQGRPELSDGAGLVDMRHRVLLTEWGRFTAPDPTGPYGGTNPYIFAGNNSFIFVDPTGELFFLAPIIAGAVVGGVLAAVTNWDKSGADFAWAVAAGAAGGAVAAIPGLGVAGFALGGALTGAITGGYQGYTKGGVTGALVNGSVNAAIGGVAGLVGGYVGAKVSTGVTTVLTARLTGNVTQQAAQGAVQGAIRTVGAGIGDTGSRILSQYVGAGTGGAVGGFAGGFSGGTLQAVFSTEFANAEGVGAAQVALSQGWHQGVTGAGWGFVGGVGAKAVMQGWWLGSRNPEGGSGLNKVLGFEGEYQAQKDVGASKSTFQTPNGKRPDIWNATRWWSGKRIFGDVKNTNKIPSLNSKNGQLRDMLNSVPNVYDPANPTAGGNKFTIFHAPGIKLPGSASRIGGLNQAGVIDLVPLRQFVFGDASTNDHIC